ncbi:sensor histidine kinase [Subsaximicrobium wynnwilliamsii]|uniref:histidine kinase n=1 Tax=Subsaximicrobium wynnwilliamsii TaxID=291179 RepID=A0A5C6ZDD0_9FLAO|nr:sensor histidine kinase [Subsaximicrobium wynnwilliamsii]TXD81523.1 sensor histidine kinase [Subsaximicrobium wynnwilliamsii]TXD87189.1 sensor histidine kinase [Subsaximicrobium wynnwilliamsii]TXE00883.1 sensor histidine kinase [Subsaximicrobium wynnwilliamsii]
MSKTEEIQAKLLLAIQSVPPNLDDILFLSRELAKQDPHNQRFYIDAKTLIHLGRDSIKDHSTALLELVKNSYDADATKVDIEIFSETKDLIRVADNGFGMTSDELKNSWLRIGYSGKRVSTKSKLGRRKTGEKGIGRISTDRLGSILELRTKSKNDKLTGLKVNWDDFDVEGKSLSDIRVEIFEPSEISLPVKDGKPSATGTEIIIERQRQPWSKLNIENLQQELSALTPPFEDVQDFKISLVNDIYPLPSEEINSNYLNAAEIKIEAYYPGTGSEIIYTYWDKYNGKEVIEKIEWSNLLTRTGMDTSNLIDNQIRSGSMTIKLYFFLREGASVKDLDFNLTKLREFLDNNAGIKIYRDRIVVKPYGFPSSQFGYDWLGLADRKAKDPAGISRSKNYSVTPNQLVGAVFIARDSNIELADSAAREGLVESEAFYDLKSLVMGTVNMLESYRTKLIPKINEAKRKSRTKESRTERIIKALNSVEKDLYSINLEIQNNTDIKTHLKERVQKNINQLSGTTDKVEKTITELLNWNRTLSGLATIGISSAVFGHETEGSITQLKGSVMAAKLALSRKDPNVEEALNEIAKAVTSSTKVAAWGAYALTRVQREKRSKKDVNIGKIINSVVNELEPAYRAASITLNMNLKDVYTYTYQMDIETLLINLMTNAYTAATNKSGKRVINIQLIEEDLKESKRLVENGYALIISDSGPGVSKEYEHRLFEPLFSTKVNPSMGSKSIGTGLGLTVVNSIVQDLNGKITFDKDPELKGARFKIWLPKERKTII